VNIRELDEESRRTGVWPPRRIILRVERDGADAADAPADGRPVKVGEVDLAAPLPPVAPLKQRGEAGLSAPLAPAPPKPRAVPAPLPAPSLSPSVTPSRRPGLPGARGVTPAASPEKLEDEAFSKWLNEPLAIAESNPEYQAPPTWLPDDVRVRASRRHRRVARKGRAQFFGASAATTLAIGAGAAALALVGLSQTETVGGSLGVPSIGLFGSGAKAPSAESTAGIPPAVPAVQEPRKPAAKPAHPKAAKARRASVSKAPRRATSVAPRKRIAQSSAPRSTPSARTPTRAVVNPPAPVRTAPRVSNPPPAPPPAPVRTAPKSTAPQTNSSPTPSVPVAPSRPANSPAPTNSAPAGSSPSLGSEPGL
jgi:hypothetical protein